MNDILCSFMFKKFLHFEKAKIDKDKWYEGIQISADPGEEYVLKWIKDNACGFRKRYDRSKCKTCKKWYRCGELVIESCFDYESENYT